MAREGLAMVPKVETIDVARLKKHHPFRIEVGVDPWRVVSKISRPKFENPPEYPQRVT